MKVTIDFEINEDMIKMCIIYLLEQNIEVTKTSIKKHCKQLIKYTGNSAIEQPIFSSYEDKIINHENNFYENVEKLFNKLF